MLGFMGLPLPHSVCCSLVPEALTLTVTMDWRLWESGKDIRGIRRSEMKTPSSNTIINLFSPVKE